ncbi:DUF3291 domain-containing protein [Sulfitobacter sp. F26204]|uniref:DUF3291 domain-containing protein n=1 Tax=Sulfitobacter sp. F26204 TaxID=2996014 RepID=UPI002B1FA486|nr:DUF3291 domain-containing protein [Sulfitobacter sp. F26204]
MWFVPVGHRPTLDDPLARLAHRQSNGDSAHAFGWALLSAASMHRTHGCRDAAVA